ncbi:hypothetical protein RchiOBHm_Chr1g0355731 [Rosa chinensis]|uniref:Uncharacterized protein n=1 Tax=Rosa chinensis TaxID=74649 RepID=A0A2P6SHH8_ROSCH|nr:hypothetical protein RchiOBHm_Chr1g0355731 [Rosa chinensis]
MHRQLKLQPKSYCGLLSIKLTNQLKFTLIFMHDFCDSSIVIFISHIHRTIQGRF